MKENKALLETAKEMGSNKISAKHTEKVSGLDKLIIKLRMRKRKKSTTLQHQALTPNTQNQQTPSANDTTHADYNKTHKATTKKQSQATELKNMTEINS